MMGNWMPMMGSPLFPPHLVTMSGSMSSSLLLPKSESAEDLAYSLTTPLTTMIPMPPPCLLSGGEGFLSKAEVELGVGGGSGSGSGTGGGMEQQERRRLELEFLREYGIEEEERVMGRLMTCPAVSKLRPLLEFLESQGFSRGTIARSSFWHGAYLKLSKKNVARVIAFFLALGFPADSPGLLTQVLRCSAYRIETLQERVDVLAALAGLSPDQVAWLVRKYPRVLELPHPNVRKKVEFLLHMLQRDVKELLKWPRFLSYSIENRLLPRSQVMAALKEGGFIHKDYSLKYIFDTTDEVFHRRFTSMLAQKPPPISHPQVSSQVPPQVPSQILELC